MARFATAFASILASSLLGGMLTVGACSTFEEEAPSDGGSSGEASSANDGGSGGDAGGDGGGEAGPSTFCSRQKSALFCDDFDQPGRTISAGAAAPWDLVTVTGNPLGALGSGPDNSRALHLRGAVNNANTFLLRKGVDISAPKKTRIRFKMRVDQFTAAPIEAGTPYVLVATIQFPGDKFVRWSFARDNADLTGFAQTFISPGTTQYYGDVVIPPPFGQWVDITLEIEPAAAAPHLFRIKAGNYVLTTLDVILPAGADQAAFALGAQPYGGLVDFDARFDDVVIERY